MKKRMKTTLLLAGTMCITTLAAIGFASCDENQNENKIEFLTTELKYEIGDNIDVFTYVKKDTEYSYEFSYQKKGSDELKSINGRTFVVDEAGVYTLYCKATKDSTTIEDSVEVVVYDLAPFAIVPNQNLTVDLGSEYALNALINMNGNVFIVSSSSTIRLIDYAEYFENEMDKEGEIVTFYDTTKPMEEFDLVEYKKQKIKFDKEGIWDFHVHVQNKGGVAGGKFRVKVVGERHEVKYYKAIVNADGSISMLHKSTPAGAFTATTVGQWAAYHEYYAYTGDYGVGNYLDFSFTGLNMPQFIFFADGVEGDGAYQSITNYGNGKNANNTTEQGRKGVVVLNGLGTRDQWLQVFGPNRMDGEQEYGETGKGELLTITYGDEDGAYNELIRKGQVENRTKQYKLTVGTHLGEDGMVWLEMILKDVQGNVICHLDRSLGLTEAEVGTGDIIVLPPFGNYTYNGEDLLKDAKPEKGGTTCVFESISVPYIKKEEDK